MLRSTVAVARLDLDPDFALVARLFITQNIVVPLKGMKRTMRGRSLVNANGASQESKDMRIQLGHGRLKVGSDQCRWQPMDISCKSARRIQSNLTSNEQRSFLIHLGHGTLLK